MVPSMMSKLQLVGLAAQRDSHQLMSKTNSEDRLPAHEPSNRIHRIGTRLRIARPVRQEHSVWLECQYIFRESLCRDDRHLAAFAPQFAQDVLLDAEVVSDNVESWRLVFHSNHSRGLMRTLADFPDIRTLGAHLFSQVHPVHLGDRPRLRNK